MNRAETATITKRTLDATDILGLASAAPAPASDVSAVSAADGTYAAGSGSGSDASISYSVAIDLAQIDDSEIIKHASSLEQVPAL